MIEKRLAQKGIRLSAKGRRWADNFEGAVIAPPEVMVPVVSKVSAVIAVASIAPPLLTAVFICPQLIK
jgi:hypothetical protein